jgi:uncharacterized protein YjdB
VNMKKIFYLSGILVCCLLLNSVAAFATVPNVTLNPNNDTVCSGTMATYTIAAVDTPGTLTMSYRWQVSTDGGTSWSSASGAGYTGDTTTSLSVLATLPMSGYRYRCIASNTDGADTSGSALLKVVGIAPGTIAGPSAVCKTFTISLTDTVSGGVWSSTTPAIATISAGGVVTGHLAGYDTIKYTATNMCGTGVTTMLIRVDDSAVGAPITGPTATCRGNFIVLSNSNVSGTWSWGTSNGNASAAHDGHITGVSYGLDTVYYVFTNACNTVTNATVISVDTLLPHGSISGSHNLCIGTWIHLTESIAGGSWFSSNSSIAVVDPSGYVTGVSLGAVTISYYFTNACGASVATFADTVSRPASMIAGLDSVGVGFTRTLSDSVAGGIWTSSDTSIATVDTFTGVVYGRVAGSVNISYTVTNYCGTSTSVMVMHVGNPPTVPAIGGAATVCIGSTITLTNAYAGGTWGSSNSARATVNSAGVVTGVAVDSGTSSTVVNISYILTNGFGSTTVVKAITVLHTPIISISGEPGIPNPGINYFIRGVPAGGTWTHTNPGIANILSIFDSTAGGIHYATFASYIMLTKGTDVLHYQITNACGSADSSISFTLFGVGVEMNTGGFSLSVYPNPAQGEFTMNLAENITEQAIVTITNVVGEKVKELTTSTNKLTTVRLNAPAGIYMLNAVTPSGRYSAKIAITQ